MRATVITDASFCPETKAAGWACWIRIDGRETPIKHYGSLKVPVSAAHEAEMLAALNGLWLAYKYGATSALLQTDCLAVVNAISGAQNHRKIRARWVEKLAACGLTQFPIRARHVKGHTRIQDARSYVNRWCDAHAKQSMREQRSAERGA